MDKINIQTLVPNGTPPNTNGNLDINSLVNMTKQSSNDFSPNQLIHTKNKKREKLLEIFTIQYNKCIEKIKLLNSVDKTDLVFSVPYTIPDCSIYTSASCIDFIESKLRFINFDTLKINIYTLFITWKYLELNMN
jgi:hypothetical protein